MWGQGAQVWLGVAVSPFPLSLHPGLVRGSHTDRSHLYDGEMR